MINKIKFILSCFYVIFPLTFYYIKEILGLKHNKILVLYYHSFPDKYSKRFIWQMETLQKLGKIVSINRNHEDVKDGRLYAITIDDGFQSILNYVLPELKKRNIPCTIFLPSGYLGLQPGWQEYGSEIGTSETVMSKDQIKMLDSVLVKIGSHTVNHPKLSQIPLLKQVYEINESKNHLEKLLGCEIKSFSFPYGDYNPQVVNICQAAGYDFVFNTEPRYNTINGNGILYGRVSVEPSDNTIQFKLKILGGYNWMSIYLMIKNKFANILSGKSHV